MRKSSSWRIVIRIKKDIWADALFFMLESAPFGWGAVGYKIALRIAA